MLAQLIIILILLVLAAFCVFVMYICWDEKFLVILFAVIALVAFFVAIICTTIKFKMEECPNGKELVCYISEGESPCRFESCFLRQVNNEKVEMDKQKQKLIKDSVVLTFSCPNCKAPHVVISNKPIEDKLMCNVCGWGMEGIKRG